MNMQTETLTIAGQTMTLRDIAPTDEADVLALHRLVFGGAVDGAWFDWKYVKGGGQGVGLWHAGQLIAHCGGVPRHFRQGSETSLNLQIGDVMVAPQWRGILTRRGPFFHVSRRLYNTRLGDGKPFHMGFGFPSARHLDLAVRSGLLWRSGVMTGLRWAARAATVSRWRWRVAPIESHEPGFDATVSHTWARMQSALPGHALGARDVGYVRWRYVQRPGHTHRFVALRRPWSAQAVGIAVMGQAAPGQDLHWLDWIGPAALMPLACALVRNEAAAAGCPGVTAWASQAVVQALAETGFDPPSEVAQIGMPCTSDVPQDQVPQMPWWFMGGDTDFL